MKEQKSSKQIDDQLDDRCIRHLLGVYTGLDDGIVALSRNNVT
jgi:hypothetical protein